MKKKTFFTKEKDQNTSSMLVVLIFLIVSVCESFASGFLLSLNLLVDSKLRIRKHSVSSFFIPGQVFWASNKKCALLFHLILKLTYFCFFSRKDQDRNRSFLPFAFEDTAPWENMARKLVFAAGRSVQKQAYQLLARFPLLASFVS